MSLAARRGGVLGRRRTTGAAGEDWKHRGNIEGNICSLQTLTWWSSTSTCIPSPAAPSSCLPKRSGFPLSSSLSISLQVKATQTDTDTGTGRNLFMQSWCLHVLLRVLGFYLTFCFKIVCFELLEMHKKLSDVCRVFRVERPATFELVT